MIDYEAAAAAMYRLIERNFPCGCSGAVEECEHANRSEAVLFSREIVDAALPDDDMYAIGDLDCIGWTRTHKTGKLVEYQLAEEYIDLLVREGGLVKVERSE